MVNTFSNRVIKQIMFGFNFIFVITGIIILTVGASVKAYYYPYEIFLDDRYFSLPNMLIATGSLIFFISFLGCYGAMRENWMILMVFSVLLSIIFIFELSVGIAGYVLRDKTSNYIESTLSGSMVIYDTQSSISSMWDVIQEEFECCGVHDYNDWQTPFNSSLLPVSCCPRPSGIVGAFYCNSYTHDVTTKPPVTTEPATSTSTEVETTVTETTETAVPDTATSEATSVDALTSEIIEDQSTTVESTTFEEVSSTTTPEPGPDSENSVQAVVNVANTDYPYSTSQPYSSGCLSLFGNFVKQHAVDIGAVGISLAVIQLLGICLSFYMARQLKNGYYST